MEHKNLFLSPYAIIISMFITISLHGMEDIAELVAQPKNSANSFSLAQLPDEILMQIFSYCITDDKFCYENSIKNYQLKSSLANDIKKYMQLSTMCTKFNRLLTIQTIGDFCRVYSREDKYTVLRSWLEKMKQSSDNLVHLSKQICRWNGDKTGALQHINCYKKTIKSHFHPAFILLHANNKSDDLKVGSYLVRTQYYDLSLLKAAIIINDEKLVETLLNYDAYPYEYCCTPLFFHANTVEVVKTLIDYNETSIHRDDETKKNVLWHTLDSGYPVEVMELYIKNKISSNQRDKSTEDCLLHELVRKFYEDRNDCDFLKKVALLLNTIPKMVNTLNTSKQTPLDVAEKIREENLSLVHYNCKKEAEKAQYKEQVVQEFEKLNALLREHGCLTAQEIEYNNSWQGKLYNTISSLL